MLNSVCYWLGTSHSDQTSHCYCTCKYSYPTTEPKYYNTTRHTITIIPILNKNNNKKTLPWAFLWGCQVGTILHQCFIELGPLPLQTAQQWCLASTPLLPHDGLGHMPTPKKTDTLHHTPKHYWGTSLQQPWQNASPTGSFSYSPAHLLVALSMPSPAILMPVDLGGSMYGLFRNTHALLMQAVPKSRRSYKVCQHANFHNILWLHASSSNAGWFTCPHSSNNNILWNFKLHQPAMSNPVFCSICQYCLHFSALFARKKILPSL